VLGLAAGTRAAGETPTARQVVPDVATALLCDIDRHSDTIGGAMPFTQEQFLGVFRDYNVAVWPVQWILNLLAVVAIGLAARGQHPRVVVLILAGLWAWMGTAYHLAFFATVNRAAVWFGAAFLVEALLLLWQEVVRQSIRFEARRNLRTLLGVVLLTYALLLYPLLGYLLGRRYPSMPTFGLPCPTTILTFGLFLWAVPPLPLSVVAIPAPWSLLGFSAAMSLSVTEDYGLLIAGVLATVFIAAARRSHRVSGGYPPTRAQCVHR